MNKARLKDAGFKGILVAIGAALIATGVGMINNGEMVAGGILSGVGAVMLMVANYVGR